MKITLPAPIRISHGPSPVEPGLWLVTTEWDDDIQSLVGTVEDARLLALQHGLRTEHRSSDGVATWTP